MRRALASTLLLAGLSITACGGGSPSTTVSGHLELSQGSEPYTDPNFVKGSGQCFGTSGYDDITEGASVTVEDASGTVVGSGSLGAGHPSPGVCVFAFTVKGVPSSKFYKVEVSHRGYITVDKSEVGAVGMSLGE